MLIEVGQKYINASGDIRKIEGTTKSNGYPFKDFFGNAYAKDGKYAPTPNDRDLICLVDENLLKQYEAKEITKKEFIAKHIELYTGEKL